MNIESKIDLIVNNFKELKKSAPVIDKIASLFIKTFENGGKVLFCGNGGSAADAQHLAAEFVVKYKKERKGLKAIALTTDTSILTAIGNDLGAEKIFERQVEALGEKGDILFAISTSGNSENIILALKKAKALNMVTVVLTGAKISEADKYADVILKAPSDITNNVQEMHIAAGHIICEIVENSLH